MTVKTPTAKQDQNDVAEPEPIEDTLAVLDEPEEMNFDQDIPDRVRKFVDSGYTYWLEKPRKWRGVKLTSTADVKRVKRQAQDYARQTSRQFRTKKMSDPLLLVYRVTDAPQKKDAAE